MQDLITQAIRERRLLRLTYDSLTKTVEPHVLGVTRKKQKAALLCWQVSPPMRQAGYWRLFDLADIADLQLLDTRIAERPEGPRPPLEDFTTIDALLHP